MQLKFVLTGKTPLLMHADNVEAADELKAWQKEPDNKGLSTPGDDRTPPWTWQTYLYHDGVHLCWPSANLMVCLRQAGAQVIMARQKTFKEATQSGLAPQVEFLELLSGDGKPVPVSAVHDVRELSFADQKKFAESRGFRLDVRRARIGQSKHIRVRPRFDQWTMRGHLDVLLPDLLTPDVLGRLFTLAGNVGLGDWRPGCRTPGVFGQFAAAIKIV